MPGQIKQLIDEIMRQRSGGHPTLLMTTKTKLILKGLNPDKFNAASPDDPAIMAKVLATAREMGVQL